MPALARRRLLGACSGLFALCLAATLAGCGWHPRGSQQLAPQLHELRLRTDPSNPRFNQRLRNALRASGIELVESAAAHTLSTGPVRQSLRNVALDRSARSAEQEMRLTLEFELRNPDGDLVFGPREISSSRIYAYDPNSVIAKQDEELLIGEELQDHLVGQLFRQLSRIDAGSPRP